MRLNSNFTVILPGILLWFVPGLAVAKEDYWQCNAHDAKHQQWLIQHKYSVVAHQQALQACKQASFMPDSCQANLDNDCEGFYQGHSTQVRWQCSALDESGKTWRNQGDRNQDNAVLHAMSICQKHSRIPETCYVNPLSCDNINKS